MHVILIGLRVNFNKNQGFICKIVMPHALRSAGSFL
jgi:hypothetical protein